MPPIRARWPDDLDPQIRRWLTRTQAVTAYMHTVARSFAARPSRTSIHGRIVVHDALVLAIEEYQSVLDEVQRVMATDQASRTRPGSMDRVEEMRRRASEGLDLFQMGDRDRHD